MEIYLTNREFKPGRFVIECDEKLVSPLTLHMFDHCTASFDNPEHINDSQQNRTILEHIMVLHGCQCIWTEPLPVKRKKVNVNNRS